MPRFAANLSMMYTEHAFLDRFEAAARDGFEAVEYLFPYEHAPEALKARLDSAGLAQVLFNAPPGDWAAGERGIASLPGREDEFRSSIDQALAYARVLGNRKLHVMAGIVASPDARVVQRETYLRNLAFAAQAAQADGVTILIEPINTRDVPGYFLRDFAQAAAIIAELGLPNLKLLFDIYHRQILHGDVIKGLEALLPVTGHVQTASVPGRNEPGTGELDDRRVFETLDRLGYGGVVGLEYRPKAGTVPGLAWMQAIKS